MSEPLKIAVTAVFGVFVFVVGQVLQRLFIEPLQEQRKLLGKIAYALTFYANAMAAKQLSFDCGKAGLEPDELKVVVKELRGLGSELRASQNTIPLYSLWVFL